MKITIETDDVGFCEMLTKLICCSEKVGIEPQYKYDWANVPDEVMWIATDSGNDFLSDIVWGYVENPEKGKRSWWVQQDDTDAKKLSQFGVNPYKGNWKDSLERRPEEFGG